MNYFQSGNCFRLPLYWRHIYILVAGWFYNMIQAYNLLSLYHWCLLVQNRNFQWCHRRSPTPADNNNYLFGKNRHSKKPKKHVKIEAYNRFNLFIVKICTSGFSSLVIDWFIKKKREIRTICSSHFQRLWYCPSLLNEQTCRASRGNMLYPIN